MLLKKNTILVVDDDAGMRETLGDILSMSGYRVFVAGTGKEAEATARREAVDAALIDLRLPDMDGMALLRLLKAQDPELVCCMVTGHASLQNAIAAVKDGASDYFIKPLAPEEMLARLKELLDVRDLNRELRESEIRCRVVSRELEAVLNAIPDVIIHHGRDLKALWGNQAAARVFKVGLEELPGLYCYERWHSREGPCNGCTVTRTFLSGEGISETVVRDDGSVWDIRTVPLRRPDTDQVESVIELARDITEHRQLEEQFRQSQKMDAVGQLAGGVAHDFNNLLTVIMGFAKVLGQKTPLSPEDNRFVGHIIKASEKAADLTHALLTFSRKQIIRPRHVLLNDVITEMAKIVTRVIGEDINFTVDLSQEDTTVFADSGQVSQVLLNLATNARDAMPGAGNLAVRTKRLNVDEAGAALLGFAEPGAYVGLEVSDTGSGMDETTRLQIFEPFFTTKPTGKGTGLGLALVYGIVKQHNGAILVESAVDKGTTFRIYLPASLRDDEETAASAPVPVRRGQGETILVADDSEEVCLLISKILEEFGYRVIVAGDGRKAVKAFEAAGGSVDLLLFDVVMPNLNGREAYEAIARIQPNIPAIFMSGYTADIVEQKGASEQGIICLSKPLAAEDLLDGIARALQAGGGSGKDA